MTAAEQWLNFANDDLRSAEILLREGIFNEETLRKANDIFAFIQRRLVPSSQPPNASQSSTSA